MRTAALSPRLEPVCRRCAKTMVFVHSVARFERYPQLDLYRCSDCGDARTVKRQEDEAA